MKRPFVCVLWLVSGLVSACDSDPVALTPDVVAGSYVATSFQGGGADILAAGGSLSMSLAPDGSVSGMMNVPTSVGGPLTADMVGTYRVVGNALTFTQDADTFVRDATWTWADGVLAGAWAGGGESASVRMERR